jgi:hypothetical protein
MSTRRLVIILSIVMIAIVSIIIFIELVIMPQKLSMDSEKISPFAIYMHSNLSIRIDGKPLIIPTQIGIDNHLWNNHSLDKFGVPGMPMDEEGKTTMPGMAPLYTTNDKGRITVGSIAERNYTLQDFLNIWGGIDMSGKKVNATVNDKPVTDYSIIILKDKEQIKLDIYSYQ